MRSPKGSKRIALASLLTADDVLGGLDELGDDEILRGMIERMAEAGALRDPDLALHTLVTQKCSGFAYLKPEIAVFHARVAGMSELHLALAPTRRTLRCCWTTDAMPMRPFALVLAPQTDPTGYLRGIAALEELHRHRRSEVVARLTLPVTIRNRCGRPLPTPRPTLRHTSQPRTSRATMSPA